MTGTIIHARRALAPALLLVTLLVSFTATLGLQAGLIPSMHAGSPAPSIHVDPELERELRAGDPGKALEVWLLFHDDASLDRWLLDHPGVPVTRRFSLIAGVYLQSTAGIVSGWLARDGGRTIKSAWLERRIQALQPAGLGSPRASTSPSMPAPGHDFLNFSRFRAETGLDGRGIIVGLLSTGVGMHPDLVQVYDTTGDPAGTKVIANVSFVDWDPLYIDVNGEGTYLAGIIAGTGNASNGEFTGVAPGARVINAKCVDLIGITLWHWAVSALEFCFTHGADIIVAGWNIFGYPGDPLTVAVDAVSAKGVLVVSAPGDLGPAHMTVNTPGMASSSICAGAVDATGPFIVPANFSGRGPTLELKTKPDVVLPGVNITSCLPSLDFSGIASIASLPLNVSPSYGTPLPSNGNYTTASTTAASAGLLAGACALLLQDHQFARPEIIKDAILRTAVDLGRDPAVQGAGLVNVSAAHRYLAEHRSRVSSTRTSTPAQLYAGFVPNYIISGETNRTALWFASSYGSMNFFTYFVQDPLGLGIERNVTHLLQGMFGLHYDGQFNFFLMDQVFREMHLTHIGSYTRAVSILNHKDRLLVIITAETWRSSLLTMNLRFDIVNVGMTPVSDVSLHAWWKADLDVQADLLGMAADDVGGYDPVDDLLHVSDTSRGPDNSSFFMVTGSRPSTAVAVGGLSDTISWVQDNSTTFTPSTGGDSVDNVTLAAKYLVANEIAPGDAAGMHFATGCGFDFISTRNATLHAIDGHVRPVIVDLVVVHADFERMYEVRKLVDTSCMVINTGNQVVNDTVLALSLARVMNASTVFHVEQWNLGALAPLQAKRQVATWSPVYESMYTMAWIVADMQSLSDLVYGTDWQSVQDIPGLESLLEFDPTNMTLADLLALNGSLSTVAGFQGIESNPLDNVMIRDVFVYEPARMLIHQNVLPADAGLPTPRPYAGIHPARPVSAPMRPEFIGDFALYNLTVYTTVPLTGLRYTITGNASVRFIDELSADAIMGGGQGAGSIPSEAITGTVVTLFIDTTFLSFPRAGHYISHVVFTSDQGHVETVIVEYTIAYPRGKILFDVSHNDLLSILTGDQRDMIMGAYHELYTVLKQDGYDMDEYIIFDNLTQMSMEGINMLELYDAIILPDPEKPFLEEEVTLLLDYFQRGGKIIVLANADGGNYTASNVSLGGLSGGLGGGISLNIDFEFSFDFNDIKTLVSGGAVLPDTCNLQGLAPLVNRFGFQFGYNTTASTNITNVSSVHPITAGFPAAGMLMHSYTTFSVVGNHSQNTVLAWDDNGLPVAAIHENATHGGMFVLVGDADMFDAYHLHERANAEFIARIVEYMLGDPLDIEVEVSKVQIYMGDPIFLQARVDSSDPGVSYPELLGIIAFIHPASGEKILMQFFHTVENYYATFLFSGGLNLTAEYTFPPFNNTGEYYALIFFNHPRVTGAFTHVLFEIVAKPPPEEPRFVRPTENVLFQGLIIFSASMGVVIFAYFSARRKQEESMAVPELDARTVQTVDNLLMELESKMMVVSEEIRFSRKQEDYKTRISGIEAKIGMFKKSVDKLKKLKKRISRF